jgi:hypothetical protein
MAGKDSRSHKWREKIRVLNLAGTCLLDPKGFCLWGLKGFRVSFGSKGFRVSLESERFPWLSKRYLIFGGRLKQNEEALITHHVLCMSSTVVRPSFVYSFLRRRSIYISEAMRTPPPKSGTMATASAEPYHGATAASSNLLRHLP